MKQFLLYGAFLALPAILAAQSTQTAPQTAPQNTQSAPQTVQSTPPAVQNAPQADQKNELGITRRQADDILNELRQIRGLLEKQAGAAKKEEKPQRAALNLKGYEPLGSKRAPVTVVEFTDYQCPFCENFFTETFAEIKKNFIDTGKVRFYSRDYPLDFHANAFRAAEAGRCAGDQGKFWKFRELMGADPHKLEMPDLLEDAGKLKMDINAFRTCVESDKYKSQIESDILEAFKIGADGTPAFVIGKSTPDGVEGELVVGAYPYATFAQKLKDLGAK